MFGKPKRLETKLVRCDRLLKSKGVNGLDRLTGLLVEQPEQ